MEAVVAHSRAAVIEMLTSSSVAGCGEVGCGKVQAWWANEQGDGVWSNPPGYLHTATSGNWWEKAGKW